MSITGFNGYGKECSSLFIICGTRLGWLPSPCSTSTTRQWCVAASIWAEFRVRCRTYMQVDFEALRPVITLAAAVACNISVPLMHTALYTLSSVILLHYEGYKLRHFCCQRLINWLTSCRLHCHGSRLRGLRCGFGARCVTAGCMPHLRPLCSLASGGVTPQRTGTGVDSAGT